MLVYQRVILIFGDNPKQRRCGLARSAQRVWLPEGALVGASADSNASIAGCKAWENPSMVTDIWIIYDNMVCYWNMIRWYMDNMIIHDTVIYDI
jgi:hypothetical protein